MEYRETLTMEPAHQRRWIVLQVIGWVAAVGSFFVPFLATGVAVAIGIVLMTRGSKWSGAAMIATSVAFTALITAVAVGLSEV